MVEPNRRAPLSTRFIARHWLQDSWLSRTLAPLDWLHGGMLALRRANYRLGFFAQHRLPVPVIVIGNFFIGGTGKTPLVVALVEALRRAGFSPGVVSRGYGSTARAPRAVRAGDDAAAVGDEPLLIAERTGLPVWIGRQRAQVGHAMLAAEPSVNVIVCDDGLQHLALARDIEIAVFDERGVGNGRLLPAGPLRERVRPVDAVVCNGAACSSGEFAMTLAPAGLTRVGHGPVNTSALAGLHAVAIAGIGNPARFFRTLADIGVEASRHVAFPDHHRFTADDLRFPECDAIVMTEKDAVKCRTLGSSIPLYALRVDAKLDASFAMQIIHTLQSVRAHGRASA
ncbi:MAG: tetraacyldisaccharide 4'-kinase [Betaproteobacteria bacterium]|nr:tetraacyldisaccharide 4'-kinase [Betaproteobacteria bacterium]